MSGGFFSRMDCPLVTQAFGKTLSVYFRGGVQYQKTSVDVRTLIQGGRGKL